MRKKKKKIKEERKRRRKKDRGRCFHVNQFQLREQVNKSRAVIGEYKNLQIDGYVSKKDR